MAKPLHTQFDDLDALHQALSTGKISATELAQSILDASDTYNAFAQRDVSFTQTQAQQANDLIKQGQTGQLLGIPIAHSDLLVTQHWRTTAGSKMLENYISPFDATAVSALQTAGMVTVGKLICDEFGLGSTGEHALQGHVVNPWNARHVTGGAASASAAAVASGLVPAATAIDTGGDARLPASWCGVSTIKPSYGLVSRHGVVASGSSLEQVSPIARHARDLALLLDALSGFDTADATSLTHCHNETNQTGRVLSQFNTQLEHYKQNISKPLQGIRLGIAPEIFEASLDAEIKQAINTAIQQLETLGAECVEISLPHFNLAAQAHYIIHAAEASTNLSRYDGVHFGYRSAHYTDLQSMMTSSRSQGFGPEAVQRILFGTYVLSESQYDAYFLQAQRARHKITLELRHAFTQCDFIIGPVSNHSAPQRQEKHQPDPGHQNHTACANLAGLPAASIPCGIDTNSSLPIGLHLIGNYFSEGQLLALADCYQQASNWHQRKPE